MPDRVDSEAPRVVLVTAPDAEVGRALARAFLTERLAACVNLVPGIESHYRWEGAVQCDAEVLLIVKTTAGRMAALEALLADRHPYDTPECVALEPSTVEAKYLRWLVGSVAE